MDYKGFHTSNAAPAAPTQRPVIVSTLDELKPGDEYVVEWNDGDRQRYRVEEIRGDNIIRRRWMATRNRWTDWVGVQKLSEIKRHKIEFL